MKCAKCSGDHDGKFGSGRFCSINCANSRTFSQEVIEKKRIAATGKPSWNKGIKTGPRKPDSTIISTCAYCKDILIYKKHSPKKYHPECWKKCSGGYRKGSGVGKSGWYKDHWCDSMYGLIWIIYQLDHNKDFKRNKQSFEYNWNGKIYKYIPDFIQDNNLIEIKGYCDDKVFAKLNSVPNLKILFKSDLLNEFNYVYGTFGKQLTYLYTVNPYNKLESTCVYCGKPCKRKNIYCSRQCAGAGNNKYSKLKKNIIL